MDLITHGMDDARSRLANYLSAHGFDSALADGPVGARYLALREAERLPSPEEAFGRWFAAILGGAPDEAESLGWIAFLIADGRPQDLLSVLPETAARAIRACAPTPAFEAPLAMPAQDLARRSRRRAAGPGFAVDGRAA